MENEKWATVKNYEQYEISDMGNVRSWRKQSGRTGSGTGKRLVPKLLKPQGKRGGYQIVRLYNEDRYKQFSVHKLVWENFMYKVPEKDSDDNFLDVNHINSVRDDNRLENLEVITHKQNVQKSRVGAVKSKSVIGTGFDGREYFFKKMKDVEAEGFKAQGVYLAIRYNREYFGLTWKYAEKGEK